MLKLSDYTQYTKPADTAKSSLNFSGGAPHPIWGEIALEGKIMFSVIGHDGGGILAQLLQGSFCLGFIKVG